MHAAIDEEAARAEIYALLARLFHAPPDAALLDAIRGSGGAFGSAGALAAAWAAVAACARDMDAQQIRDEYDVLFGGVGKPEIALYGSHYLSGFLNDRPLVRLRGDLAALGFERNDALPETEDHIAGVCEVMRELIRGPDAAISNLEQQRRFFAAHLQTWTGALCDTIAQHPAARFHAALARFAAAFFAVEAQAFDMLG
jgi:TorA maturation chaperone TorD